MFYFILLVYFIHSGVSATDIKGKVLLDKRTNDGIFIGYLDCLPAFCFTLY